MQLWVFCAGGNNANALMRARVHQVGKTGKVVPALSITAHVIQGAFLLSAFSVLAFITQHLNLFCRSYMTVYKPAVYHYELLKGPRKGRTLN